MKTITAAITKRAEENPTSLPIQNSAARQALQSGDNDAAVQRSEKAVALAEASGNPTALKETLATRAMAHYAKQDFVGACADADQVTK